jgi:hypothetical protein
MLTMVHHASLVGAKEDNKSASDLLSNFRSLEGKKIVLEKDRVASDRDVQLPVESKEYITIREREKRLIEERIRKQMLTAQEQPVRSGNTINNQAEQNIKSGEPVRIIGEKEIIGTPKVRAAKKKISRTKKMLLTIFSFATGLIIFLICMGYLFWRFAPPGDSYKANFVQWMSANASGDVNNFLFNDMSLNDYYTPPKIVDYSGVYLAKTASSIGNLFISHQGVRLNGNYQADGKDYKLSGYTDNKGDFLLLETYEGTPSAILRGTLFSTGYLTGERFEQSTGKKEILSLEKRQPVN